MIHSYLSKLDIALEREKKNFFRLAIHSSRSARLSHWLFALLTILLLSWCGRLNEAIHWWMIDGVYR